MARLACEMGIGSSAMGTVTSTPDLIWPNTTRRRARKRRLSLGGATTTGAVGRAKTLAEYRERPGATRQRPETSETAFSVKIANDRDEEKGNQ